MQGYKFVTEQTRRSATEYMTATAATQGNRQIGIPLLPDTSSKIQASTSIISREELENMLAQQMTLSKMATTLNISRPTLYKLLRLHGLDSAFKNLTNEKVLEHMQSIAFNVPQAKTDPNIMRQMLNRQSLFINENRFNICYQRFLFSFS